MAGLQFTIHNMAEKEREEKRKKQEEIKQKNKIARRLEFLEEENCIYFNFLCVVETTINRDDLYPTSKIAEIQRGLKILHERLKK